MRGPGGAFALVAVQLLSGTFIWLVLGTAVWRVIARGHWRSVTWVLAPLMLATSFALPGRLQVLGLGHALAMGLFLGAVYSQRPLLEWLAGAAGLISGVALLGALGAGSCDGAECISGAALSLAGGAFVGAVTHSMALGHWYLNQPRLPIEPLRDSVRLVVVAALPVVSLGLANSESLRVGSAPGGILAVSSSTYWWVWMTMMIATVVVTMMAHETVKTRSTQSATGLLYIAMVPALVAQFLVTLLFVT